MEAVDVLHNHFFGHKSGAEEIVLDTELISLMAASLKTADCVDILYCLVEDVCKDSRIR